MFEILFGDGTNARRFLANALHGTQLGVAAIRQLNNKCTMPVESPIVLID